VAPFHNEEKKRRWRVKDNMFSPWRDLTVTYTGAEISEMLSKGRFSDVMPADETPPKEVASDD
jgi:hypothetical protein